MRPGVTAALLFLCGLITLWVPSWGHGWRGGVVGGLTLWLIYLLLSHTPENKNTGTDTGRAPSDDPGRD